MSSNAEDILRQLVALHVLEQVVRQSTNSGPEVIIQSPDHGDAILALRGKIDFKFKTVRIPPAQAKKFKVVFKVDGNVVGEISDYQTGSFIWDPKPHQQRAYWVHTVDLCLFEGTQQVDHHTRQFCVVLPQAQKSDTIEAVVDGAMLMYRQAGDRGARAALRLLQAGLRHLDNNNQKILYMAACTCSVLGEHDAAIGFLQRVSQLGAGGGLQLLLGLHADPDFERLKRERPAAVAQILSGIHGGTQAPAQRPQIQAQPARAQRPAAATTPLITTTKQKRRGCCCW